MTQAKVAVPLLGILLVVLILTALVSAGVLYLLFCQTPEKRWKDQVFGLRNAARRSRQVEKAYLQQAGAELQAEEQALTERAFQSLLQSISVDRLEAFPGIASGTTSRLRQFGYTTLATLQRAHIRIHGLGAKRLADIRYAVDHLTRDAWSRLQQGSICPERADLERRLRSLRRDFEAREFLSQARHRGLETFLKRLQGLIEIAQEITFTGYLGLTKKTALATEHMEAELPSLEKHLHAVEAEGNRAWQEREGKHLVAELAKPGSVSVPAARVPGLPARPDAPVARAVLIQETPPTSAHGRPVPTGSPAPPGRPRPEATYASVAAPVSPCAPKTAEKPHADIMELTIQLAFAAARADGRLAKPEKAVIEEHVKKRYWYDQVLFNRARALCAHYESAPINVDDCLRRIKEQFAIPHRTALVNLAVEIAAASKGISAREQEFLDKVSRVLEIALPRPAQIRQPSAAAKQQAPSPTPPKKPEPVPAATDPRSLLELDAGTALNPDLIRRHFNRAWERLDPDKMAAMGDDFVTMAQSKRAALRAAAVSLMAPFGEELEPKTKIPPPRDMRENRDLDQVFGV